MLKPNKQTNKMATTPTTMLDNNTSSTYVVMCTYLDKEEQVPRGAKKTFHVYYYHRQFDILARFLFHSFLHCLLKDSIQIRNPTAPLAANVHITSTNKHPHCHPPT